jgi:hypothetical protein
MGGRGNVTEAALARQEQTFFFGILPVFMSTPSTGILTILSYTHLCNLVNYIISQ